MNGVGNFTIFSSKTQCSYYESRACEFSCLWGQSVSGYAFNCFSTNRFFFAPFSFYDRLHLLATRAACLVEREVGSCVMRFLLFFCSRRPNGAPDALHWEKIRKFWKEQICAPEKAIRFFSHVFWYIFLVDGTKVVNVAAWTNTRGRKSITMYFHLIFDCIPGRSRRLPSKIT
jgi:hypothetical protein